MDGIFKNASVVSVAGNQRLCGGIRELQLPPCKTQKSLSKKRVVILVTVLCSAFLIVVLVVAFLYRKKPKRKVPVTEEEQGLFPKVSYAALSQATNEFSPSNLLGKGSFGSVYKGVLDENKTPVAVKVLNLEQKGASKSFLAECEALCNIRHRNLIKIMTVCSSIDFKGNDFKAIVYELMQNGSLEDWLHPRDNDQATTRSAGFSFIQMLNTAIDVAYAIEYLHYYCEPAIVHGDLKPSNILLDHDMVAHVGDFGLSILLNKTANNNASDQENINSSIGLKGTIGYVAPEYGMGSKASMAGDVYSFGIMLLEMITGKRPTDPMFEEGFSIHHYTKTTLPERVMEILEPSLVLEVHETNTVMESMIEVARIGVLCSVEAPNERMDMKQVVVQLSSIKQNFLRIENATRSKVNKPSRSISRKYSRLIP